MDLIKSFERLSIRDRKMNSRRYQTCGKYDGSEPAGRWLRKLTYDLKEAGVEETPEVFFESIDLNLSGEAVDWVDSTPQFQIFTEQIEVPTKEDVKRFKVAFLARFPAKFSFDESEDTIQEDTNNLIQGRNETLSEYYGRAQHLLRRSHTRDKPSGDADSLSPAERILLGGVIKAFLRGCQKPQILNYNFRRVHPNVPSKTDWRAYQCTIEPQNLPL